MLQKRKLNSRTTNRKRFRYIRFFLFFFTLTGVVIGVFGAIRLLQHEAIIRPIPNMPIMQAFSLSEEDQQLRLLKEKLFAKKIAYKDVQSSKNENYIITFEDKGIAIVTFQKNMDEQLSSLQLIMNRLTMEGKRFSRLDLRFDEPVVVAP